MAPKRKLPTNSSDGGRRVRPRIQTEEREVDGRFPPPATIQPKQRTRVRHSAEQLNEGDDQDEAVRQQDTGAANRGQFGLKSQGMSFPLLSLFTRRNTAIKVVHCNPKLLYNCALSLAAPTIKTDKLIR
jgi:hypothetical protein